MTDIDHIIEDLKEHFAEPYSNIAYDFLSKDLEQYVIKAKISQLHKLNFNVPECFQVQEMIVGLNKELDKLNKDLQGGKGWKENAELVLEALNLKIINIAQSALEDMLVGRHTKITSGMGGEIWYKEKRLE